MILGRANKTYFEDLSLLFRSLSISSEALTAWVKKECTIEDKDTNQVPTNLGLTNDELTSIFSVVVHTDKLTASNPQMLNDLLNELNDRVGFSLKINDQLKEKFLNFFKNVKEALISRKQRELERASEGRKSSYRFCHMPSFEIS